MRMHAEELKKQIIINQEKKKVELRTMLEEGRKVKNMLASERIILDDLKKDKIRELQGLGVDQKFTTQLTRKKIDV